MLYQLFKNLKTLLWIHASDKAYIFYTFVCTFSNFENWYNNINVFLIVFIHKIPKHKKLHIYMYKVTSSIFSNRTTDYLLKFTFNKCAQSTEISQPGMVSAKRILFLT